MRKKEEESGKGVSSRDSEQKFELIEGKKKKSSGGNMGKDEGQNSGSANSVSKLAGSRSRIPFHIASIPRPQEEYNIRANNLNEPFQHVWLQTSEDGTRLIHPLEKFSELDFVDRNDGSIEPVKPLLMESTPFKLVEEVKDLKELVAKLHAVKEFAIDLEHNKYRSFQGLTCLMQISTRMEDFVVDTLKLRVHIGPYLRDFFKDPTKKKVMHGAECDILWLQRDFSIYVCNLFDTGQASRVLQLERNSLEYLLSYYCGVTVNKEYQNADWRQRPLPDEMLKYAREDTHYLLYMYDIMRERLISASRCSKDGNDLLLEVYKRSYDVCFQFYEKDLLTDTSYLHIYGLQEADFNAQQLAVVAGLCEWRDAMARTEDESTGYILPNKALLEIARQMPLTSGKLRRLVKSKYPYVECNLISVLDIINCSIKNAAAFENAAQELQKGQQETVSEQITVVSDGLKAFHVSDVSSRMGKTPSVCSDKIDNKGVNRVNRQAIECSTASMRVKEEPLQVGGRISGYSTRFNQGNLVELSGRGGEVKKELGGHPPGLLKERVTILGQMRDKNTEKLVGRVTEQVLKSPDPKFGALLEKSVSKEFLTDPKDKVDQIKSSIIRPYDLFKGRIEQPRPLAANSSRETQRPREPVAMKTLNTKLKDISLRFKPFHMDASQEIPREYLPLYDFQRLASDCLAHGEKGRTEGSENVGNASMSLSELSSKFRECLQLTNETRKARQVETAAQEMESGLQSKAFDCAAARERMKCAEHQEEEVPMEGNGDGKDLRTSRERYKNSETSRVSRDKETEFAAG